MKKKIYFTKQRKIQWVFQLSSSEMMLDLYILNESDFLKKNYICIVTQTKKCSSKTQLYNFDSNIMYKCSVKMEISNINQAWKH